MHTGKILSGCLAFLASSAALAQEDDAKRFEASGSFRFCFECGAVSVGAAFQTHPGFNSIGARFMLAANNMSQDGYQEKNPKMAFSVTDRVYVWGGLFATAGASVWSVAGREYGSTFTTENSVPRTNTIVTSQLFTASGDVGLGWRFVEREWWFMEGVIFAMAFPFLTLSESFEVSGASPAATETTSLKNTLRDNAHKPQADFMHFALGIRF
jgi:hypothetical protein